jgi:hypothetical protein
VAFGLALHEDGSVTCVGAADTFAAVSETRYADLAEAEAAGLRPGFGRASKPAARRAAHGRGDSVATRGHH